MLQPLSEADWAQIEMPLIADVNAITRFQYRRTLVHELGHVVIGQHFDVRLREVRIRPKFSGTTDLAIDEAATQKPFAPWHCIRGMIAVAGAASSKMADPMSAQSTAVKIVSDFQSLVRFKKDRESAYSISSRFRIAANLSILVEDVRGILGPKMPAIIAAAEELTRIRMLDERSYREEYSFSPTAISAALD